MREREIDKKKLDKRNIGKYIKRGSECIIHQERGRENISDESLELE